MARISELLFPFREEGLQCDNKNNDPTRRQVHNAETKETQINLGMTQLNKSHPLPT